jgi:hypothetical protein
MPVNWNLGLTSPATIANNAMAAFDEGMERGRKIRLQGALAAFSANPDDPRALQGVMAEDPQLGVRLADFQDKRQYRAALGDYLTPDNALLGTGGRAALAPIRPTATPAALATGNALAAPQGSPTAVPATGNALGPIASDTPFNEAFSPLGSDSASGVSRTPGIGDDPLGNGQPGDPTAPNVDLTVLGQPKSRQDAAFLRMLRSDPLEAIKIQSTLRDNFMDRLKAEHQFYSIAADELSGMTDDAGWQRALERLHPMAQALGANLLDHVPTAYPGPDGVKQLLERVLPVKERLDYFARQANTQADNERADRNTDSMIETREGQLAETHRYHEGQLGNQRRGQDLTDKRQRDRPPPAARGVRGAAAPTSTLPLVHSPAEARKLPKGTRFRTPDGQVKIVP